MTCHLRSQLCSIIGMHLHTIHNIVHWRSIRTILTTYYGTILTTYYRTILTTYYGNHLLLTMVLYLLPILTTLTLILATETRTIMMPAQLVSVGTKLDARTSSLTMLIQCFPTSRSIYPFFINAAISPKPKELQTRDTHFWNQQVVLHLYVWLLSHQVIVTWKLI